MAIARRARFALTASAWTRRNAMLLLNLAGLGVLFCGLMAAGWPFVISVQSPYRWIIWGSVIAALGVLLLRL